VENQRVINLIDECGSQTCAVKEGWMNITSHKSVLAALENQANRFSNQGSIRGADANLVSQALDETGTVDVSFLCNNHDNNKRLALTEHQERNRVAELGVPEEVL
jgi:hypothetical protein